jgi:Apea-like HEPN
MTSGTASELFSIFHQRLRALVEQQNQAGKLRALPLSPLQLAREAERLDEFNGLVTELFELGSPEDLEPEELEFLDDETLQSEDLPEILEELARERWNANFSASSSDLSELLKRSGYYHDVLSGSDDVDRYYCAIRDRIPAKVRTIVRLYLLDGCDFSRERFEVAGIPVVRMSPSEIEELGPAAAVCSDFFPNEAINSDHFSKQWFLKVEEGLWTAYDYERWDATVDKQRAREALIAAFHDRGAWPKRITLAEVAALRPTRRHSAGSREVAAGQWTAAQLGLPTLPRYLDAILLLSLYNREFFEITKILVCEPNWRRIWFRSTIPRVRLAESSRVRSSVRPSRYSVDETHWSAFESYVTLGSAALRNVKASKEARAFIIASHRYLQATFATGDVFPQWETKSLAIEHPRSYEELIYAHGEDRPDVFEDAVLHYVFALEALLTGDTREAITDKVAISAALLIGRDDDEAVAVRALVKRAYDCRSALVHGRELKELVDVDKLRHVCQRVLTVALSLYAEQPVIDVPRLLRDLPVSRERQQQVEAARERILALLGDDSSLSELWTSQSKS